MKKKKLLGAMSDIDERFIEEAAPKFKSANTRLTRFTLIAAVIAILTLSVGLWLFVPYRTVPAEIEQYTNSEYYDVIAQLNALKTKTPIFKNNFERYMHALFGRPGSGNNMTGWDADIMFGDMVLSPESGDPIFPEKIETKPSHSEGNNEATDVGDKYHETTDNQVDGVVEADLFKRSDKYIFYLSGRFLRVYSIAGEASELVAKHEIVPEDKNYAYVESFEMFLSEDASTLTIITPGYDRFKKFSKVTLLSLDVSDPENGISVKNSLSVTGSYVSARLVDGDLLLITRFTPSLKIDFSDESLFLPRIDTGDGLKPVSADSIICPDKINSASYTTICRIDENTLTLRDDISLLSFAQDVYVSKNNIFAIRGFERVEHRIGYELSSDMTEIACVSYENGEFRDLGSVTLEGFVKDQYSLDEFEGILRVVTTTTKYSYTVDYSINVMIDDELSTNASLYCVDLQTMKVVSSVIDFAPEGETVRSVRFDGNAAYVCTAIQLSDPVFFFDLSDIRNITYKETGTIEGFSSSLIELGGGYLLGIGYGSSTLDLKIEIYKESENGVVSVCKYERKNVYFSPLYKSYYVNRDEGLIGLGIGERHTTDNSRYTLLHFNGYELCELLSIELASDNGFMRAVLIDGYFYMLGGADFKVEKIF